MATGDRTADVQGKVRSYAQSSFDATMQVAGYLAREGEHEHKISLPEIVVGFLWALILDICGWLAVIGVGVAINDIPIVDIIGDGTFGFYIYMKGLPPAPTIINDLVELIPIVGDIWPGYLVAWGLTIYQDRNPKSQITGALQTASKFMPSKGAPKVGGAAGKAGGAPGIVRSVPTGHEVGGLQTRVAGGVIPATGGLRGAAASAIGGVVGGGSGAPLPVQGEGSAATPATGGGFSAGGRSGTSVVLPGSTDTSPEEEIIPGEKSLFEDQPLVRPIPVSAPSPTSSSASAAKSADTSGAVAPHYGQEGYAKLQTGREEESAPKEPPARGSTRTSRPEKTPTVPAPKADQSQTDSVFETPADDKVAAAPSVPAPTTASAPVAPKEIPVAPNVAIPETPAPPYMPPRPRRPQAKEPLPQFVVPPESELDEKEKKLMHQLFEVPLVAPKPESLFDAESAEPQEIFVEGEEAPEVTEVVEQRRTTPAPLRTPLKPVVKPASVPPPTPRNNWEDAPEDGKMPPPPPNGGVQNAHPTP